MAIAEIFISAFVSVLFEKLSTVDLLNFVRQEGIDYQFKKWKTTLSKIQSVLADAEKKQIQDEGVKLWLGDLQDLAYDLDDLVDEFATEVLRRKLNAEPQPSTSKVWSFIPTCCTNFKPSAIIFNAEMKSKIEAITTRLNDIFIRRLEFKLEEIVGQTSGQSWRRPETTSVVYDPQIYGRENDKRQIIELLVKDESSRSKVGVVPLRGMGGIGKTTLAQSVYNDETVKKHFDLKAWVCVSDEFDIKRITKVILESVTSRTHEEASLDRLQVKLIEALTGKKFLIVLDDVWNKNHGSWIALKAPFNHGAQGSKILVTTRRKDIAKMMGTVEFHEVGLLSIDDCWSLFAQYAFENGRMHAKPKLVSIGKQIVEKCGGLPLAARTLGGLLRSKEQEKEWKDVLHSNIWNISPDECDIIPALRLSYLDLPSHLKQCFAYCAIIPKDYEFEEKELILWWMAEGYIQRENGDKQMEEVGSEYFHELVSRSLFLPSNRTVSTFVMHDLINDLAYEVARSSCFRLEDALKENERHTNLQKARHASYVQALRDGIHKFDIFYEAKHLRTFLPFSMGYRWCYLSRNVLSGLLPKLSYLRNLSLRYYQIEGLPDSVGNLKHLRHFDLSYSRINKLPDSFGDLYNLQTLMLEECDSLKKISIDMAKLTNLRHLYIPSSLEEMPLGIGKLTGLQTLSHFIITKGNGSRIKELGDLNHLGGTLCISGLENITDVEDARKANLKDKKKLTVFSMLWRENLDDLQSQSAGTEVFDALQPHKNLREFHIKGFPGAWFPDWMGDPLFSNMVTISFENCEVCTSLPQLGRLPSLKKLYIGGMTRVKYVGHEFYGQGCAKPFQMLEELSFVNMQEWEDWKTSIDVTEVQPFTFVKKLVIKNCPKLSTSLPCNLPCLETLETVECRQLQVEVKKLHFPSLTSLSMKDVPLPRLSIDEVKKVVGCSSLTSLNVGGFSVPDYLCNPNRDDGLILSENLLCKHLSAGSSLKIKNIQNLTFLPKWLTQGLMKIENLSIRNCDELVTLWKNDVRLKDSLQALRHLKIRSCKELVSFFEEEDREQEQKQIEGLSRLEFLSIFCCGKLEKLPQELQNFMSLKELKINGCSSLVYIPVNGLPCTLKILEIKECDTLQSLPGWNVKDNDIDTGSKLEELRVNDCESLKYLISGGGGLPPSLRVLEIEDCPNMLAVLEEQERMICFPSLEIFSIFDCGNLKYLPDANLLGNNNNLRMLSTFHIGRCGNLECIPQGWFTFPTHLTCLQIHDCENLTHYDLSNLNLTCLDDLGIGAIGISSVLERRIYFPSNLTHLDMGNTKMRMPPSEWGLHRFSSLKYLFLYGPIVVITESESETKQVEMDVDEAWSSFPFKGMSLPISLTFMDIRRFKNLEALSPELQLLTSLTWLSISECPMISSFPSHGLPQSLLHLEIEDCPKLKEACEKGKGKYWPLIAPVPLVDIG